MKKALLTISLLATLATAHCQWSEYGVKVGIGGATIQDDLSTKSSVMAVNVGAYANFTFAKSESILAEIFYLQTGLNLIRRGNNFQEVFETANTMTLREGYNHAWYVQLPVLANVHYELPLREAGHNVGFFLGPAISVGVFGQYGDRRITPGVQSLTANYDLSIHGTDDDRAVFNHLNRIDVSALVGFYYEHKDFLFSFHIDHGFTATSSGEDMLRLMENNQSGSNDINVQIPNGNNSAFIFSVSYRLGYFR
ncbi:MAG: PorT family protein [Bacteroidales bacterium]|nr:PorT family protein [Bacteroidales bacterium]